MLLRRIMKGVQAVIHTGQERAEEEFERVSWIILSTGGVWT